MLARTKFPDWDDDKTCSGEFVVNVRLCGVMIAEPPGVTISPAKDRLITMLLCHYVPVLFTTSREREKGCTATLYSSDSCSPSDAFSG